MDGDSGSVEEMGNRPFSDADAGFSKWQLDAEEKLEEIYHYLIGEGKDMETGLWKPIGAGETSTSLMNKIGANDTISLVRFVINKDTALSYLDEEMIEKMCLQIYYGLINLYLAKAHEYGIDPVKLPVLLDFLMDSIYIYMMRACGGRTLNGIQRWYKVLERLGGGKKDEPRSLNLGIFGSGKK